MWAEYTLIHRGAQILHNAMQSVLPFMSWKKFKMVNCTYFHYTMNYRIIFRKNIPYSVRVFKIKNNIIAIITGGISRNSCTDLLQTLKIWPVQSQYIFHLLLFVVNNKHKLNKNYDVYSINIKQKFNFQKCLSHLSLHQKGIHSFSKRVFNKLQLSIQSLTDYIKQLKSASQITHMLVPSILYMNILMEIENVKINFTNFELLYVIMHNNWL
jgi:hypothetical protein